MGIFSYSEVTIKVGEPASFTELLINFILGFIIGFKILGIFFTPGGLDDPKTFMFSGHGNIWLGILAGIFFLGWKWREKNKPNCPSHKSVK